jgi:Flp pilus assembly protein TadG
MRLRTLAGIGRDTDGIAATEFALIAPIMLVLYFGVTELCDGLMASTKAESVASTAADLAAQNDNLCNAEVTEIFNALDAIMFPYSASNTKIVISSVVESGNGQMKVAWSDAHNATPRSVNSTVSGIPAGLVTNNSGHGLIMAEVTHDYSSPAGKLIYGTIQMRDTFYTHPRRTTKVTRTTTTCTE